MEYDQRREEDALRRRSTAWLATLAGLLWGLAASGAPVVVVCTTTIVQDVARVVAGPDAVVTALLPAGADPHAIQPSPQDAAVLEQADVVFLSGAGLEAPLAPLLATAHGRTVDLSAGVSLYVPTPGAGDGPGIPDPHVWFDPRNVMEWTRAIARTLSEVDPDHALEFAARASSYEADLTALDAWIVERVATLSPRRRRLVTDHDAFGYFARRYGFELVGTIFPGTSTLAEPSARDVANLEDAILSLGVPVIFVGTTVPTSLAEQVAADTGMRLVFLYTGSLSEADGPAPTYLDFMRFDVDTIVSNLGLPS